MPDDDMRPGYDPADLGPGVRGKYYDRAAVRRRAAAVPDADLRAEYERAVSALAAVARLASNQCGARVLIDPADRAAFNRIVELAVSAGGFEFEEKT